MISRITAILYVIKRLFNRTNLSIFLHSFLIFLTPRTTVKTIQVIIIYSVYYSSSIALWSFFYNIFIVDCWPVCSYWSYQCSLIPKNYPWVCYQIFCGTYPKCTYGFTSPAGLWKVVSRVLVGCSDLFASIDLFYWSKIFFKLLV